MVDRFAKLRKQDKRQAKKDREERDPRALRQETERGHERPNKKIRDELKRQYNLDYKYPICLKNGEIDLSDIDD